MRPRAWVRRLIADDEGAATIVGVAVVACLVALTAMLMYLGSAVVARHRVASAADLAALAAASALMTADGEPCVVAEHVVRAQGDVAMRVELCRIDGEFVDLTVAVKVGLGPFGLQTARASARAGPERGGV